MSKRTKEKPEISKEDEELAKIVEESRTKIKIVGAGGAGNNTVTRLMEAGIRDVETIAINTDALQLLNSKAHRKLLIGKNTTRGLGAGANPQIGMEAAQESKEEIKEVLDGADLVFLTCGLGGGCLRGDSLIYTNPDGPVRIDSIKPGSFVYSLENGKLVKKRVLAAMKTGIKKVLEVKTNNNTIYASYDHPFLKVVPIKPDKKGRFFRFKLEWAPAESLKVGDRVVILREVPESDSNCQIYENFNVTKDFCRLFGFLLGDGWISKSKKSWHVYFSPSQHEEINRRYLSLFKKVFDIEMKKGSNWYYASSKRVYEILEKAGLKKRAKEKEIPCWIFNLPKSFQKEFILGLADADGYYYRQKGKKKLELRFEMHSEKLIRQLKVLCNYLGLRTSNIGWRIREVKPPHSKQKIMATSWNLRIYRVYKLDEKLEKWRKRKGIGLLYGYRGPTNLEFFKYFGFVKIKSIKEIGEEEVYDITVEGSHNFVAEGFVVHNTGSGSLPVIAEIAKRLNALIIGVVTLPFSVEGKERMRVARETIEKLQGLVNTLIVIPNDKLLEICPEATLIDAFRICDEILINAVKGIAELITKPGIVNRDFADIKTIMSNGGLAMIGLGESNSENRAKDSVEKAIKNPLLAVDINDAKGALIHITSGPQLKINEVGEIIESISSKLSPDAKILWGATIDEKLKNVIRTLLIITGVKSPQIFGPLDSSVKKKKRSIEKDVGVELVE